MVGLSILAIESAGFLALRIFSARAPLLFELDWPALLDDVDPERLRAHVDGTRPGVVYDFDRALGWIRAPGRSADRPPGVRITSDDRGSRVVPAARGPVWIASYGDSFTEGLDVGDADTWQAGLARATGTRVLNFGVSGYGPDQALLLLERHQRDGIRAPVVVLAMIDENRNRLVNFAPRFYNQPAGPHMSFKPRFVRSQRGWTVQSFMPGDPTDADAVRAGLRAASLVDPFVALRRHRVAFPFAPRALLFLWREGLHPEIAWPGDRAEAWAILEEIADRFVALGRRSGFVPVLVRIPQDGSEIAELDRPRHTDARDRLERPGLVYVDVAWELAGPEGAALAPDFDPADYLARSHPSARGNAAIAVVLEHALRRAGAAPETATDYWMRLRPAKPSS